MNVLPNIRHWLPILTISLLSCGVESPVEDGSSISKGGSVPPAQICFRDDAKGCAAEEYCHFPEGSCGEAAEEGRCSKKAEFCATIYLPVCGCDAKTYPNACTAAGAGISVRHQGPCWGLLKNGVF